MADTKSIDSETDRTSDEVVDVLVVGSGAGGMVSALTANAAGLSTVIVEKSDVFGGSTAMSGGGAWLPGAPAFERLGERDDPERTFEYLVNIAGEVVSHDRLRRYVHSIPEMMKFLEGEHQLLRDGFWWNKGYPDYHPDKGGHPLGRGLWATPITRKVLGEDEQYLRPGSSRAKGLPKGMWLTGADVHSIIGLRWGVGITPVKTLFRLLGRIIRYRFFGERIAANGSALATRLRVAVRDAQIPLRLRTPMRSLITDGDGCVIGAVVESSGHERRIMATRGVILATGGFEHNAEMRREYQPGVGAGWSVANPDNTGDGHHAGVSVGGALALMDSAWWYPVIKLPHGYFGSVVERQFAGQYIVNGVGQRFVNEASPYTDFGRVQVSQHEHSGISHIPAWMIVDDHAWKHNFICAHFPGLPMPKDWLKSGDVKRASTIEELADQIGVPRNALRETHERFNRFARNGKDEDFGRGESIYEHYYANPTLDNPNLDVVGKPPFYAFQIYPGDLGTKGGLLTDEHARVLREDGSVISGLYACGNASASVMGYDYAGPGATIGPAMTFAWVAARHIAELAESPEAVPH